MTVTVYMQSPHFLGKKERLADFMPGQRIRVTHEAAAPVADAAAQVNLHETHHVQYCSHHHAHAQ